MAGINKYELTMQARFAGAIALSQRKLGKKGQVKTRALF
jgi:hypothetical protein